MKFIFIDEQNEVYGRKSWLANKKTNQSAEIFLRKLLTRCQAEILDHDLKENLITSTINCQIKVFRKDEEGKFKSVLVKSKTPNAAIKRSKKNYHAVSKRLGESPGDGVNILKSFCMDSSAVTSNDDFQETDPKFSGQNK